MPHQESVCPEKRGRDGSTVLTDDDALAGDAFMRGCLQQGLEATQQALLTEMLLRLKILLHWLSWPRTGRADASRPDH